MAESSYVVILITTGSYEEAHKIADALVCGGKAACVNIVPKANSLFRWQGKVEEAEENLLLVKTRAELFSEVVRVVKGIHSYEMPEIIALPVVEGDPGYLAWITKETEMRRQIKITVGGLEVEAWLNETDTATKVLEILPITSTVNLWGDEIYFSIPLETGLENAREVVNIGDIAYWPQGKAMCIFLGMTPISKGKEIRPISPVNVIGGIEGVQKLLGKVKPGEKVTIRR